ncbi:hypothetical protein M5689_018679 [Euphorbia peplus]|nr:hypothetical protein M5689_018679 [Euphorbia peplus]
MELESLISLIPMIILMVLRIHSNLKLIFSFTSLLQDFETDHAFAEYQEYLLNQQSNQSDIVQNHVVSCGEGDVVIGGLAPNYSIVNDHVLSPKEEKAMLEFTPTPGCEMMMDSIFFYGS